LGKSKQKPEKGKDTATGPSEPDLGGTVQSPSKPRGGTAGQLKRGSRKRMTGGRYQRLIAKTSTQKKRVGGRTVRPVRRVKGVRLRGELGKKTRAKHYTEGSKLVTKTDADVTTVPRLLETRKGNGRVGSPGRLKEVEGKTNHSESALVEEESRKILRNAQIRGPCLGSRYKVPWSIEQTS